MIVCDMNRPWGDAVQLHQLRQVRAGLPHRRAGRKGLRRGRDGETRSQRVAPGRQAGRSRMKKVRLATVWLDGCSGCHMSLLDMDEAILAIAKRVDVVYGPLVDAQEFPKARGRHRSSKAPSARRTIWKRCTPSASAASWWWRSAIAPSPATCPAMRNQHPGAQAAGTYLRGRRADQHAESPSMACPPSCARPCRSTKSSRWISTCRAVRRSPAAIAYVLAETGGGPHAGSGIESEVRVGADHEKNHHRPRHAHRRPRQNRYLSWTSRAASPTPISTSPRCAASKNSPKAGRSMRCPPSRRASAASAR